GRRGGARRRSEDEVAHGVARVRDGEPGEVGAEAGAVAGDGVAGRASVPREEGAALLGAGREGVAGGDLGRDLARPGVPGGAAAQVGERDERDGADEDDGDGDGSAADAAAGAPVDEREEDE